jgi:transcriptional antiterminator RfaH
VRTTDFLPSNSTDPWYLIHCQPRKEAYAAQALITLLGVSAYLPECKVHSRGKMQYIPFFPGYLFVQVDLQKVPPSKLNTNPGVVRLVEFGGDPQVVPPEIIEETAERLRQLDGMLPPSFRPGDTVRMMRDGALQDLEMIFVGPTTSAQRVCVLLNFLGRLKEVHVDTNLLEKAPANEAVKTIAQTATYRQKERYTRGKGRKIKRSA